MSRSLNLVANTRHRAPIFVTELLISLSAVLTPYIYHSGRTYNENSLGAKLLVGNYDRHPGTYHRKDPDTGGDTTIKLVNTNESMHASVRTRWNVKGLGKDDGGTFRPAGMYYFTFEGDKDGKTVWKGDSSSAPGVMIPEDKMGKYELQLLDLFDKVDPETNVEKKIKTIVLKGQPAQQ